MLYFPNNMSRIIQFCNNQFKKGVKGEVVNDFDNVVNVIKCC